MSVSLLVSKDGSDSYSGLKVALHYIKNKNIIGQEWQNIPSPQITSKYKRFTFTFTLSDDVENLNLMLFGEKGRPSTSMLQMFNSKEVLSRRITKKLLKTRTKRFALFKAN